MRDWGDSTRNPVVQATQRGGRTFQVQARRRPKGTNAAGAKGEQGAKAWRGGRAQVTGTLGARGWMAGLRAAWPFLFLCCHCCTLCYTQSSPFMVSFAAPIKSPHTLHFVLLVAARKKLVTGACVGEGELGFPGEPVGC